MLAVLDYSMANIQKEKAKGKFLTFWQDSADSSQLPAWPERKTRVS
jgi:hypothetical protein